MSAARTGYSCGLAALLLLWGAQSLQNAVAEGDTRTISLHHIHTDEDITITYKRDGRYDDSALEKLNWFLRDWRKGEQTRMDPHLIDLVWDVQREVASKEPIWVVCGYRSPATNAMLRHSSSGVARFSQHMLGHAMDFYIPGVPLENLRAIGLRMQRGGVGFYPTSGSPFVHMDTGNIRHWPRMTREELARVFPDGRTVHIPTDGKPMPGYAIALAEIQKRGNMPSENSIEAARAAGLKIDAVVASDEPAEANAFAKLLGLNKNKNKNKDEDDEEGGSAAPASDKTAGPRLHLKPAIVASFERVAEKTKETATKAAERVATATTEAAAKTEAVARAAVAAAPKLIRTAAASAPPARPDAIQTPTAPAANAAQSANQVILSRGYWEGAPDTANASQAASLSANTRSGRTEVASADPDSTAGVTPWANTPDPQPAPGGLALSYAEQADSSTAPSPSRLQQAAAATRAVATEVGQLIGQNGTSIAMKGMIDRPRAAVQKVTQIASAVVKAGTVHLDNPWMRAVMLSPSVHRFLTTLALGARDFTALAALMVKPSSAVMMTFSSDPNLGLAQDHFSGSAVVFIPTVSYQTRTAALQ